MRYGKRAYRQTWKLQWCASILLVASNWVYAQSVDTTIRQDPVQKEYTSSSNIAYNLPKTKLTGEILYRTLIGDFSLTRGRPEIAFMQYTILAKQTQDPRYAELAYKVAVAAENVESAIAAAKLLKELAPNARVGQDLVKAAAIQQAYVLLDSRNYRPAYDAAKALLAEDANNVAALSLLVDAADRLGYDREAFSAASKWVELEPDNPEALNSLGYFLITKEQNVNEAAKLIEKAFSLKPNAAHIIDSMGWLMYRQGRLDDALTLLERAAAMEPHEDVLVHLGEVFWKKGNKDQALEAFREAYQTNAFSPVLRDALERLGIPLNTISSTGKHTLKKGQP